MSFEENPGGGVYTTAAAVHRVGSAIAGPVFFSNSGRCYMTTAPGSFYNLGDPVDPSTVRGGSPV